MGRRVFHILVFIILFANNSHADIDISDLYLQNAGFDNTDYFDYKKQDNGNVAQEILPIHGWAKDIGVDYTVTGVYETGTGKTFNTYGKIPSQGYDGSQGGCLALSTGWDQAMRYYQSASLPSGRYKLQSAFYNGSNTDSGSSLLGWIPKEGNPSLSNTTSFATNRWTLDEVNFTLAKETKGEIQIGFKAVAGGSANSAKVAVDFVKLYLVGDNATLTNDIRSTLKTSLESAEKLLGNGEGNNADKLLKAINTAQTTADNPSANYAELFKTNATLKTEMEHYEWANASPDHPYDFTQYIINPSFEEGFAGWRQTGLKSQTNTSFPNKEGNAYIEKWVANGTTVGNVSVLQELDGGLPHGIYTLKASAQNLQGGAGGQKGAWIIAADDSTEVSEAKEYSLQFTHIDEALTIGFLSHHATGNWVAADNFKLLFCAATTDDYKKTLAHRCEVADELLGMRIYATHRKNLSEAVKQTEAWMENPSEERLAEIASTLKKATLEARSSAAVFRSLATAVDEAQSLLQEEGKGYEQLSNTIRNAKANLGNESLTTADINATENDLRGAMLRYKTENASGEAPTVTTDPRHARGATMAFARASFKGGDIAEKGFCWSTGKNPTILDSRTTTAYNNNGDIYVISGLQPCTFYYIRPYAISSSYAVGYGECIKICTHPMGNISWGYNNGGSDEENARINNATAEAVDIWNNLTSIQGLRLSVSYGANTPTADCSYGGSMRVGPNASYQRTGTIQHEMTHAAGVGTTSRWTNDATYRENVTRGFWLGERTDRVVQFLENDNSAHLKGDVTHFWPYGINGAHEDDGSKMLYFANALIIQALGEDFLPPVYGAFASPAYTFTQDDNEYYYILPADDNGNKPSLLKATATKSVAITQTEWRDALDDLSFAWQIRFNPGTQLYEFKNIQNGGALSLNNNQVQLASQENFGLQLLCARESSEKYNLRLKSCWAAFADGSDRPLALTNNYGNVSASRFDHQNSATQQRWFILPRSEVKQLIGDFSLLSETTGETSSISIANGNGSILITTADKGEWIHIHDLHGRAVSRFYMQANLHTRLPLPPGIYLVNGRKCASVR